MFVLDCVNVLVRVVAVFGVINRVPAHNIFVTPQLRIS